MIHITNIPCVFYVKQQTQLLVISYQVKPCKWEIPALPFPCESTINPCKNLKSVIYSEVFSF